MTSKTRKCDGINDCKNGADEKNCNENSQTGVSANQNACCNEFTMGAGKFEKTSTQLNNRPVYNVAGNVGKIFFSSLYQRWVFAESTMPSRRVFGFSAEKYTKCPIGTWRVILDNGQIINHQMKCLSKTTTEATTTTSKPTTQPSNGMPVCGKDVKCIADQVTIVAQFGCNNIIAYQIPALSSKTRVFLRLPKGKISNVKSFGEFQQKLIKKNNYNYIRIKTGLQGGKRKIYAQVVYTGAICNHPDIMENLIKSGTVMLQPI